MTIWTTDKYNVSLELKEPMLGTIPLQENIWRDYMAGKMSKAMKKEGMEDKEIKERIESDLEGLPDQFDVQKGLTGFLRDDKHYVINDTMIKAMLKSAAQVLKQYGALKQLQDKIRKYIFINPRKIIVGTIDPAKPLEIVERPLRAQTPQGERTAIARSEAIPAGTKIDFEVTALQEVVPSKLLQGLFEYGNWCGLGQYRTGGYGAFEVVKFEQL